MATHANGKGAEETNLLWKNQGDLSAEEVHDTLVSLRLPVHPDQGEPIGPERRCALACADHQKVYHHETVSTDHVHTKWLNCMFGLLISFYKRGEITSAVFVGMFVNAFWPETLRESATERLLGKDEIVSRPCACLDCLRCSEKLACEEVYSAATCNNKRRKMDRTPVAFKARELLESDTGVLVSRMNFIPIGYVNGDKFSGMYPVAWQGLSWLSPDSFQSFLRHLDAADKNRDKRTRSPCNEAMKALDLLLNGHDANNSWISVLLDFLLEEFNVKASKPPHIDCLFVARFEDDKASWQHLIQAMSLLNYHISMGATAPSLCCHSQGCMGLKSGCTASEAACIAHCILDFYDWDFLDDAQKILKQILNGLTILHGRMVLSWIERSHAAFENLCLCREYV